MRTTLLIAGALALSTLLLGSVAEAASQGPKGPKSGNCDPGDVLVCHRAKQGFKPICVPQADVGNHIGNHADVLADADGDGALSNVCVAAGNDCDDADPNNYPGNAEVCDGQDNNCNTSVDEGFDNDGDSVTSCAGDCDDNDANNYPGNSETCDGQDNDCDGSIDEGFDNDGDSVTSCEGDCDDADPNNYPGNAEMCEDGQDNNCNDAIDCADAGCAEGPFCSVSCPCDYILFLEIYCDESAGAACGSWDVCDEAQLMDTTSFEAECGDTWCRDEDGGSDLTVRLELEEDQCFTSLFGPAPSIGFETYYSIPPTFGQPPLSEEEHAACDELLSDLCLGAP
jgi:hypothetical protein